MCEARYFNRFEGFPSNQQAFLVHLACDLAPASATLTAITAGTTGIAAARAAAAKAAPRRTATALGAARWARAPYKAGFEGFLAVFFALTLLGVAVCADVAHGGLHWVRLRCTLWGFAATATLGAHQALWPAALFSRTRCGWTRTNAVAATAAVGALAAVMA